MNATAALVDFDARAVDLPSLEEVRRAIPERCYERRMGRGLALVFADVTFYVIAVVGAIRSTSWVIGSVAAVVIGLVVSALFVLGNDGAHDALVPNSPVLSSNGDFICAITFAPPVTASSSTSRRAVGSVTQHILIPTSSRPRG